jgi:hypothetical protein
MQTKPATKKDYTVEVTCTAPWRLMHVKPLNNYKLEVDFNDGIRGFVEMQGLITSDNAGVFKILKDVDIFNQVYLDCGVATWPGGIDLAPDAMYDAIKKEGKWVIS